MESTPLKKMTSNNVEAYPPILQRQNHKQEETSRIQADGVIRGKDIPIPVIDLQNIDMEKLKEACRDWGLFRLANHEIPRILRTQVHDICKQLFSLPFASKQSLFASPLSYFWGTPALTPSGTSLHNPLRPINLVQGFHVPLSQLSRYDQLHPKLDSFRVVMGEYGKHLARVATTIFEAMTKTLNLKPNEKSSRRDYLSESTGMVRVYRYPPDCSEKDEAIGKWGMDVHTDSSVISILSQDQVGGLELMKDGEWFEVEPLADFLIVNLGDMMQAISNDEYKSAKHRVRGSKKGDRYSICYFVFPGEDCLIQTSNYRPFTYSHFQAQVQHDINTLGFKVGLDRFKI